MNGVFSAMIAALARVPRKVRTRARSKREAAMAGAVVGLSALAAAAKPAAVGEDAGGMGR